MSIWNVIGIVATLAALIALGIYSGRRVANASDFSTSGGKSGKYIVSGMIMGALVSSQATVGTAQLAFHFGLAAWWFTLGSGIGCLLLALCYAKPLRESGSTTILQVITQKYGSQAGYIGSLLSATGIFISVLTQVIACIGLLTSMFHVGYQIAALLSIALMLLYVIFGGAWGTGMGGVLKLGMLYLLSALSLVFILRFSNGFGGVVSSLENVLLEMRVGSLESIGVTGMQEIAARYGNLVARGPLKDIGSGLSLVLGVLSTQTYTQAIWSGSSTRSARQGALISAFMIPPIGIAGILIGLYMRGHYVTTEEVALLQQAGMSVPALPVLPSAINAYPAFMLNHMPDVLGGMGAGVALIAVLGGGAGLSLGISTIIVNDILERIPALKTRLTHKLAIVRTTIVIVLSFAALVALTVPGAMINDFGFLSMGLRGAVVFLPLSTALFLKSGLNHRLVELAMIFGPVAVILGKLTDVPYDPLFFGIGVAGIFMVIARLAGPTGQLKANQS